MNLNYEVSGDENVNAFPPHRDAQGVTRVHVADFGKDYELVDGEWIERMPF